MLLDWDSSNLADDWAENGLLELESIVNACQIFNGQLNAFFHFQIRHSFAVVGR